MARQQYPGMRLHPITYAVPFEVSVVHGHTCWEFTYILKGETENNINGKTYLMKKGDLVLLGPNDMHNYHVRTPHNYEHRDLYMEFGKMKELCDVLEPGLYERLLEPAEPKLIHLTDETLLLLDKRIRQLALANPDNITAEERIIQSTLAAYLLGLIAEKESIKKKPYPEWLIHLMTEMNRSEVFCGNLQGVVELSNFSHEHLCRLFKKFTGIKLIDYLTNLKMEYALSLIRNTDFSMLQISSQIGYDSLSHFIHKFKEYYNMSPGAYRRAMEESE